MLTHIRRGTLCAALVCLVVLLAAPPLVAQTFRGGIQGTITDATGGALPGTTITVINASTKLMRTTVTDKDGNYFIPELPLGDYSLTVELPGFQSKTVTAIKVEVGSNRRVDVQLSPGGVQEHVEVTAAAPMIDTTGNTMGGKLEAMEMAALPINGGDFTKLLVLVPGSVGDPSGAMDSPGSFGLFSLNGSRGRSNNYLIDGTDMNDGYRNLPAINEGGVFGTPATILPVDAVAEINVQSGGQAEFGRNSGGIVSIVTKSGMNTPHGSAYEFFRNDALGSRNYFNPSPQPKNTLHNNQFGGSVGGPIVRDRTFFFASYEGQREAVGLPSLSIVPNVTAADATNAVIQKLLALHPWPTPNITGAGPGEANLLSTTNASNRIDSFIVKLDQHVGKADLFTGRYYIGDSLQSFPLAVLGGNVLPGYNTVTPTRVQIVSLSYIHTFSPRLLMEARGGYNRFVESFLPEDGTFDPSSIGLDTGVSAQDFGLPQFRITGYAPIGTNASVPRGRTDINLQSVLALSYSAGPHNLKMGYEFRRTSVDAYFDAGYRGVLNFDTLDDFLAGNVASGRQVMGDSRRQTFQNSHGLYVQDSYTATRTLTVDLGLRWDYMGVLGEAQNRLSILDPTRGLVQVGTNGLNSLYPPDYRNFAPRVSAVWDLSRKGQTVVRASWGIYYDSYSQDYFVGQLPWNTFNAGPAYNGIGPSPILFSYSPVSTLALNTPVFPSSGFGASDVFTVSQTNMRTPYMHNFNANVEQQLGPHAAIQFGYVGSLGRRLYRFRDINQADPATGVRPFDDGPFAPDGSTFGYVNQFEATAHSTYNAFQAALTLRNLHGFTARADYTWSHSQDNASDGQDYVPNAAQPDNSFNPNAEWADSNFDVRHRFTMTFSYQVPAWSKAPQFTRGWSLDGVLTLASGQPYNLNYLFEGDFNGSGEYFGRPDVVGDPFAGTNGTDKFLNLAAFQVPCTWDAEAGDCVPGTQHFGNLPRNAYRGPGYKNFDLAVSRSFGLQKGMKLQLRVDFFNLFNITNYSNPLMPNFSTDFLMNGLNSSNGRGVGYLALSATPDVAVGNPFLGGGGPRNIQLSAKLTF